MYILFLSSVNLILIGCSLSLSFLDHRTGVMVVVFEFILSFVKTDVKTKLILYPQKTKWYFVKLLKVNTNKVCNVVWCGSGILHKKAFRNLKAFFNVLPKTNNNSIH